MTKPKSLYKYEPLSKQALENLKNQVIYFGSPTKFNDPYNCAFAARVLRPSDDEIERIQKFYYSKQDTPPKICQTFKNMSKHELRKIFLKNGEIVLEILLANFRKIKGVSCFSETNTNLLMWSHYGEKGKGFCLEFDTADIPFDKMKKVKYKALMPKLNLAEIICDMNTDSIFGFYCTKAKDWAYEREWRCIHNQVGTAYRYLPRTLTGIYLGSEFPKSELEAFKLNIKGQNPNVQIWQGFRSKTSFKVKFIKIPY